MAGRSDPDPLMLNPSGRMACVTAPDPDTEVVVPPSVRRLLNDRPARLVWLNETGGLTFEVDDPAGRRFIKWTPTTSGIDLHEEAQRMAWAAPFTPVPHVRDQGRDDDGSWIVTDALAR